MNAIRRRLVYYLSGVAILLAAGLWLRRPLLIAGAGGLLLWSLGGFVGRAFVRRRVETAPPNVEQKIASASPLLVYLSSYA